MRKSTNSFRQAKQLKLLSEIRQLRATQVLQQQHAVVAQQHSKLDANEIDTLEVKKQRTDLIDTRPSNDSITSAWIKAEKAIDSKLHSQVLQLEHERSEMLLELENENKVLAKCKQKFRAQQVKKEHMDVILVNKAVAREQETLQKMQVVQDEEFGAKGRHGY